MLLSCWLGLCLSTLLFLLVNVVFGLEKTRVILTVFLLDSWKLDKLMHSSCCEVPSPLPIPLNCYEVASPLYRVCSTNSVLKGWHDHRQKSTEFSSFKCLFEMSIDFYMFLIKWDFKGSYFSKNSVLQRRQCRVLLQFYWKVQLKDC